VTLPVKARRSWSNRLTRLAREVEAAEENLLVGIFMARRDGVTLQVIADSIGGLSPSGVTAKARKGEQILRERKGEAQP
jgi:hypothetical protein